ncbi:hypothetical protein PM082_008666 [Marasmius tenuissimus]|nr:hypothetical protein PM082_008666 [Marasmius tenuissimus]
MSIAIYNPVCGNGTAKAFLEEEVIPLLQESNKPVPKLVATERADHAGELVRDALEGSDDEITVILGCGDGTLHEIINFLSLKTQLKGPKARTDKKLHFVLVPCGTANALYSSIFPPPTPESLNDAAKESDPERRGESLLALFPHAYYSLVFSIAVISAVVVSTSLHAAILKDSEALRKETPGIERFKVAAEKNISKWYNGHVKLLPAAKVGVVEIYDPSAKAFVPYAEDDDDEDVIDVYGPFAYFLSTVNVDRLEPSFRMTPLTKDIVPAEATCELVMIRPLRDPSLTWDSPETRKAFAPKLTKALYEAYNDGNHVNLTYDENGEVVVGGEGPSLVEYVRCGGWEWVPDDIDESSHVLCSDGLISDIDKGGRVVCTAATPDEDAGFMIYA